MADATFQSAGNAQNPIARVSKAIFNFIISISEAGTISRRLQRVAEMSDAELATLGMTREDAVQHVLADMRYI